MLDLSCLSRLGWIGCDDARVSPRGFFRANLNAVHDLWAETVSARSVSEGQW